MKILHAIYLNNSSPAREKQLLYEKKAAQLLLKDGIQWDTFLASCHEGVSFKPDLILPNKNRLHRFLYNRFRFYKEVRSIYVEYDVVLLRYLSNDPFLVLFRKMLSQCYSVHHTKEIEEKRIESNIKGYGEYLFGKRTLKHVKGIIGVTQEIAKYENSRIGDKKKVFVYPNGILVDEIAPLLDCRSKSSFEFVMCSERFNVWQGLDILLEKLKSCKRKFKFHIIGNTQNINMNIIKGDKRFQFYGIRESTFIRHIYKRCDVAFGPFALYRKGLSEACSLKVREALASGLPVYLGGGDSCVAKDSAFVKSAKEFDIENLFEFADSMRVYSRVEVREETRAYIDKEHIMRKLVTDLKG